jgi:ABC-type oligopeptide transport system ATPase subunit
VCDEVVVMHRGTIVERGSPEHLFRHAEHPYTQALLAAVPQPIPPATPGLPRRDIRAALPE